jgi:hypothetical protein
MLHLEQSDKKNGAVGVADPNAFNEQTIKAFANDESVVVLTETTSICIILFYIEYRHNYHLYAAEFEDLVPIF